MIRLGIITMFKLICKHCGTIWDYKGKKPIYSWVSCPICRKIISIKGSMVVNYEQNDAKLD